MCIRDRGKVLSIIKRVVVWVCLGLLGGLLLLGCAEQETAELDELLEDVPILELAVVETELPVSPTPDVLATETAVSTPLPSATPAPAPITVQIDGNLPADIVAVFDNLPSAEYQISNGEADLSIGLTSGEPIGLLVYAVVAPFPTVKDGVSVADLQD